MSNISEKIDNTELIKKLYSLHRFGIKPGLDRVFYILDKLGNPQDKFKSIHIAGTNGKGSTSAFISSILIEAGLKVGIYTSPHILDFRERFKIKGRLISEDEIVKLIKKIIPIGEEINATFFEITTAIAFQFFADEKVDIAIIEAGMGGKNDATNILKPIISVITKIDIDHREYLGDSIEEIAIEKSGIIKQNTPLIIGKNPENIVDILQNKAMEMNSYTVLAENVSEIKFKEITYDFKMQIEILKPFFKRILCDLPGNHQIENIKTALCVIETLNKIISNSGIHTNSEIIKEDSIIKGIENIKSNTQHRGRIDLISKEPYILIDVSHNPDSIAKLIETIELADLNFNWEFIFGAMADKNIYDMLKSIRKITDSITLTKPKLDRAENIETLHDIAKELDFKHITILKNVHEAIESHNFYETNTIIAGSFYLIEEAIRALDHSFV